jgi:hypothetical protein
MQMSLGLEPRYGEPDTRSTMRLRYRQRLKFARDEHIEAVIADRDMDAAFDEVEAIASKFGSYCCECGPIEPDYLPFDNALYDREKIHDMKPR